MEQERGQQIRSAGTGLTIGSGLAVACWFAIGPDHPVFAITIQGGFLFMALLAGPALVDVGRSRYRVRAYEPRLYAFFGAELVRRVLNVVGWNRMVGRMRQSESGDSMLARFLRGAEQSETAHLLGAAATMLVTVVAAATGHIQGAVQVLLVGFVLQGYPVMIQRMVRFRITSRRAGISKNAC
jgi:hypothetical protein